MSSDLVEKFYFYCETGDLENARQVYNSNVITPNDIIIFLSVCSKGHFEFAQWLWSLGLNLTDVRSQDNYAFRYACRCGHLELAQWLWSLGLTLTDARSENNDAFNSAYKHGHLEVIQWLSSLGLTHEKDG